MLDSQKNQKQDFLTIAHGGLASYQAHTTIINTIRQWQYQTWYGTILVFKLNVSGNIINITQLDLPLIQCLLAL